VILFAGVRSRGSVSLADLHWRRRVVFAEYSGASGFPNHAFATTAARISATPDRRSRNANGLDYGVSTAAATSKVVIRSVAFPLSYPFVSVPLRGLCGARRLRSFCLALAPFRFGPLHHSFTSPLLRSAAVNRMCLPILWEWSCRVVVRRAWTMKKALGLWLLGVPVGLIVLFMLFRSC
jgi:hypothetical protein